MDAETHQRALEINRLFGDILTQTTYFILGKDNQGIVEHPLYLLGLNPQKAVVGFRGLLIWT